MLEFIVRTSTTAGPKHAVERVLEVTYAIPSPEAPQKAFILKGVASLLATSSMGTNQSKPEESQATGSRQTTPAAFLPEGPLPSDHTADTAPATIPNFRDETEPIANPSLIFRLPSSKVSTQSTSSSTPSNISNSSLPAASASLGSCPGTVRLPNSDVHSVTASRSASEEQIHDMPRAGMYHQANPVPSNQTPASSLRRLEPGPAIVPGLVSVKRSDLVRRESVFDLMPPINMMPPVPPPSLGPVLGFRSDSPNSQEQHLLPPPPPQEAPITSTATATAEAIPSLPSLSPAPVLQQFELDRRESVFDLMPPITMVPPVPPPSLGPVLGFRIESPAWQAKHFLPPLGAPTATAAVPSPSPSRQERVLPEGDIKRSPPVQRRGGGKKAHAGPYSPSSLHHKEDSVLSTTAASATLPSSSPSSSSSPPKRRSGRTRILERTCPRASGHHASMAASSRSSKHTRGSPSVSSTSSLEPPPPPNSNSSRLSDSPEIAQPQQPQPQSNPHPWRQPELQSPSQLQAKPQPQPQFRSPPIPVSQSWCCTVPSPKSPRSNFLRSSTPTCPREFCPPPRARSAPCTDRPFPILASQLSASTATTTTTTSDATPPVEPPSPQIMPVLPPIPVSTLPPTTTPVPASVWSSSPPLQTISK